jgi:predicted anti-sigma-YlaC factor YlaD
MIMMPSCKETSALLSDRLDRKLRPMERIGLRLHLAMCRACARVGGQLEFLRSAISALPHSDDEGTSAK